MSTNISQGLHFMANKFRTFNMLYCSLLFSFLIWCGMIVSVVGDPSPPYDSLWGKFPPQLNHNPLFSLHFSLNGPDSLWPLSFPLNTPFLPLFLPICRTYSFSFFDNFLTNLVHLFVFNLIFQNKFGRE